MTELLLLKHQKPNRSSVFVWRGTSSFFQWDNTPGEKQQHSTQWRTLRLESVTRGKGKHFSNWLENCRMCPKPSRFSQLMCKQQLKLGYFLWRPLMTTGPLWDFSPNTNRFLLCWLNQMLYPKLLLEEFNLIIFKVQILMDVLSPCYPGWNLKGASVFPKWNTLCSTSHFFISGKKRAQFLNQHWLQSYFMLT